MASRPSLRVVHQGASVSLICEASGSPPPTITWYHNGRPVVGNDSLVVTEQRPGGSRLVVDDMSADTQGVYQCFTTNQFQEVYDTSEVLLGGETAAHTNNRNQYR